MPTGFTEAVEKGTITDFPTFARRCARGMSALIMQRDDPLDAPLPDEVLPSSYHAERLNEAYERLDELRAMNSEQIAKSAKEDHERTTAIYRQQEKHARESNDRYEDMLTKVMKWKPPTPDHVGLALFMMEQLRISMRDETITTFEQPSPEQWHKAAIERTLHDINYHRKHHDEEMQRSRERTAWIQALQESLREYERTKE